MSAGVLTNCVLIGNPGVGASGGTLYDCVLIGNEGVGVSGATLYNCKLTGNSGGGAAQSTLYNCTLTGNSAEYGGGAKESVLHNCTLTGNSASYGGGADQSTLNSCTLSDNSAFQGGGTSQSTLSNCTLTGNSASDAGGGAYGCLLVNCIVYFNTAQGALSNYEGCTFEYSCTTPLPPGPGNIDPDPELASATCLSPDSPCVGAGNPAYASGTDIDGEPWATPPAMGADQPVPGQVTGPLTVRIEASFTSVNVGSPVVFVRHVTGRALSSVWEFGDGLAVTNRPWTQRTWATPGRYTVRLTAYNDSAPEGVSDTVVVWVNEGVYFVSAANSTPAFPYTTWETAATNIQDAIVAGPGGLILVTNGVYRAGEAQAYGSRVALLNGVTVRSVNGPSVTVIEGAPEARCAYLGANAVLSGFTLTKGAYGGAWSSGVLTNCVLTGNSGGGVSGGTLYNCVLTGNLGGGVSGGTLYNCVLSANSNTEEWSGDGGGASGSTLHNCILTGNSARWSGGGAYRSTLYNCTVTGNSASKGAGGVAGCASYNCIVYHNTGPKNPNYDWTTLESCCAWPLAAGPGNIAADPQLASAAHLSAGSPCLGAGNARHTSGTDIDGEPWADPPAIGADQPVPGQATGPLAVRIEASHTSVGVGFAVALTGWIEGHAVSSTWDFGDGIVVSNQPWPRHSWAAPGLYTIRLTAYNDDAPSGVAAIIVLEVIEATSYVDAANATPEAPYTSWATAATNIQQAIDAETLPGRLVLVADGVYRSGSVTTNGLNRIALFNQVTVKSVNGPESAIIEGEGAGRPDDGRETRCVYVGAHAVLSGFTLRKGSSGDGGGAWCEDFGVLTNCVLTSNQAGAGGGVYGGTLYNCTLTNNCAGGGGGAVHSTLYNCTLAGNYAEQGGGAGGSTLRNCLLSGNTAYQGGGVNNHCTLYECTLTGNSAVEAGGAVSYSELFNCTLSLNSAQQYGGGAYHSTLYNCTLTANSAAEGDGGGASGGTLYNCTLTGNSARGCGGGALGRGASNATLYNCTLTGNSAGDGGGAFGATLHNCLVTSNSAGYGGGGSYGGTLYNCTVTRNSAVIFCGGVSAAKLYNCIVHFNTAPASHNHRDSTFEYSCTWPLPPGAGNLDADPGLASVTHLSSSSPCVGRGSAAYASGTDIDGELWADPPCMGADQVAPGQATGPLTMRVESAYTNVAVGFTLNLIAHNQGRVLASVWDFGDGTFATNQAFASHAWSAPGSYLVRLIGYSDSEPSGVVATVEVQVSEAVYYVNVANRNPVFPYADWTSAANNIQEAIDAGTLPGRLVLVTNGVYRTISTSFDGLNRVALLDAAAVRSVQGPEVTIIEGGDRIRCAYLGAYAVLSGFTLRHGQAPPTATRENYQVGGGVFCDASATLTNCVLTGNSALGFLGRGGGAFGGLLRNCTLDRNTSSWCGGGAYAATLDNCVLSGNSSSDSGGGAMSSTLMDCRLAGNSAGHGGGALHCDLYRCALTGNSAAEGDGAGGGARDCVLHQCTLTGNSAGRGGGACACRLYSCTLSGNWVSARGSYYDVYGGGASGGELHGCILSGNSAVYGGGASSATLYNCTLSGNSASAQGGGTCYSTLYNCVLTGNSAREGGGAHFGTLYNSIVYLNTAPNGPNYAGTITFGHSCATPLPPGPGNIDVNPRFVDAAAGDFRLRPDSPCIDAGTNLVDLITTDIEGRPRPLDGNGDGVAQFDMGAYEFDPGVLLRLTVALTPTGLRLEWPATALSAKLQRTPTLTNPVWHDVAGSETATTITLPVAQTAEFFRLVKP